MTNTLVFPLTNWIVQNEITLIRVGQRLQRIEADPGWIVMRVDEKVAQRRVDGSPQLRMFVIGQSERQRAYGYGLRKRSAMRTTAVAIRTHAAE